MHSYLLFLWGVLFIFALLPHPLYGYGEPDANGRPVYQERANHVFINAVRIAPSGYKSVYMASYSPSVADILEDYPAVEPVYLESRLGTAAYSHSLDMATNGCFSHNSCDGTGPFDRIDNYYTCSGTMGENIAAGYSDPLATNNQWLCDETGGACAGDYTSAAGHRTNILSSSYDAVGVGYAYNSAATYRNYWTQDFGGTVCSPAPTTPIYGGSHYISGSNTKFIAVYYTTPATAPSSATVVVGGTSYSLSLDVGAAGRGTYATTIAKGSGCRSYYFTFGTQRYPETGCLVTYGEGSCTTSFDATCGGSSTTATSSSTSTTKSATSTTITSTTKSSTSTTTTAVTSLTSTISVATTTGTTGSSSGHFLYSTSLQNSWDTWINPGGSLSHSATYSGQTCLSATLTASGSTNFFWFEHSPAVTNVWTTLQFYAAGSTSTTLYIFFNNHYLTNRALTTSWQSYTITFADMGTPATLGDPAQLVFMNGGSATYTVYLYNVRFV